MARKAQKSAAKARYDSTHPVISIRVPKSLYDELADAQYLTKQSLPKLLEVAADKALTDVGNAYQQGHDEGYAEGEKDTVEAMLRSRFTMKCPNCGFSFGVQFQNLEKVD